MKVISAETRDIWKSGDYTGSGRPYARATIQKMHMQRVDYTLPPSTFVDWRHKGQFTTALFGQDQRPRELFNLKSITYDRSTESDAATCTITLYNSIARQGGVLAENEQDFDHQGWYTPNRGDDGDDFFYNRWGYEANSWHGWLLPDRLIRTFEGYGLDHHLVPEEDPHMYPSGVWLIDKVTLNDAGNIELACRDLARLLLDQILFPPVVPRAVYPLWWEKRTLADNQPTHNIIDETVPNWDASSNQAYYGVTGLHADQQVNNANGDVLAHTGDDAFDSNTTTWWMSNGQKYKGWAWVQGSFSSMSLKSYRLNVRGGPYRVYVSVAVGGVWQGRSSIPYTAADGDVDIDAHIKYVDTFAIGPGDYTSRLLKRAYPGATKIRFTFTNLWDAGIGTAYPNRAAVQDIVVGADADLVAASGTHYQGNYTDYTDIVKWMCAWAGFYWPRVGSGLAWVKYPGDDTHHPRYQTADDPVLPKGRVWGDFMQTGTSGVVKLPVETFDKLPVMDGINAVREIIGFEFWVDETGAVVWRLANMYKKGNYLMPTEGGSARSTRTKDIIVIDEHDTLMDISVDIDSTNVRERVFVANVGGDYGYTVHGFNPAPSGLRRVGGWTDQNFKNQLECRRMAEMIALRQAMTYRTARITIPGNPAIQIDDQIRLYERTTGEGYLHRVTGISSNYDAEQGSWTYTLTTHWLGDEPFTKWAFDVEGLSQVTKAYLQAMGAI